MKNTLLKEINKPDSRLELTGMNGAEKGFVISQLCRDMDTTVVVIVSDHKKAMRFMEDISFFLPYLPEKKSRLLYFPGYHILPFKSLSYHGATAAKRLSVLNHLISGRAHHLVVTSVDTLLQKLIPRKTLADAQEPAATRSS